MKYLLTIILSFLIILVPTASHAGSFACQGKISTLAINPIGGTLQVDAGHGVHYLCKIHIEHNGIHPDICKAWYSMFLTAKVAGKEVKQNYDNTAGTEQNCAELGTWTVPNPMPYFIEILD